MYHQAHFISNFESLEKNQSSNHPNHIARNMVPTSIPLSSRDERKLVDYGNQHHPSPSLHSFGMDIRKGYNTVPSQPLQNSASYMFEHNQHYQYNANRNLGLGIPANSNESYDRNSEMGQRRRCAGVVQNSFQGDQGTSYFFQNFETLNKIAEKEEEINRFMERNPVNARHDEIKKERLVDKKSFMNQQNQGRIQTFHDLKPTNTRNESKLSSQSNYIPNGRTMATPGNLY
jgi:hypothetical protein